jgi:hypothetical protein
MARLRFSGLLLLIALPIAAGAAQAEVYKWTDDDGVTHYSQQPPPDGDDEANVIDPNIGSPDGAQGGSSQSQASAGSDNGEGEEQTQSVEAFCKALKEQIDKLESDQPVKLRTGDDQLKELKGDERQSRLNSAQQQYDEQCNE